MLEVNNLYKKYGATVALNGVSFTVGEGEFLAITGRSGSGKSTLLKCMGGILQPTSGSVRIDGKDIFSMTEAERSRFRNREMGFVFQSYALEPKYTGYENIEMPLVIAGIRRAERKKRILEVSDGLGITHLLHKPAEVLSGGEKQRIAIGRAIVNRPHILFADEPCGNLDRANGENVLQLLRQSAQVGITVVMITHQADDAEKADRIISLSDGQII